MASRFTVRDVLAGRAPQGASVTVRGWVRTRRDSKAGFSFVNVSDGSSFHPVQVVAANTLPNYSQEILKLTEIGRASCRERVEIWVGAADVKRKGNGSL